ncbi:hypothetical protein RRG08_026803 [Elysia crispata]|uniref:Uncharacterized protein n=1 Tax=Elysia crispata TaxID=231223 RepID=A0AAE1ARC4_9GAST|nr:hypothetical protein RRG08_026803 [Elysia crispata]
MSESEPPGPHSPINPDENNRVTTRGSLTSLPSHRSADFRLQALDAQHSSGAGQVVTGELLQNMHATHAHRDLRRIN